MKRTWPVLLALVACGVDPGGGDPDGGLGADAEQAVCGSTTCETPPEATCVDAATLRVFLDDGTCVDDACRFTTDELECPFGCSAGACNAAACAPTCSSSACVSDGCGGMCGACPSGTTLPGFTPTLIGNAAEGVTLSPDGQHAAVTRGLQPLPSGCGWNPQKVGTLDVYTFAPGGQVTRRIVGRRVQQATVQFAGDSLLYMDDVDPCRQRGDLWIARPDGRAPRRVAARVLLTATRAQDTLIWHRPDSENDPGGYHGQVHAAHLPLGVPQQIAPDDYTTWTVVSPDGSAVATVGDETNTRDGQIAVHDTHTGSAHVLTPTTRSPLYTGPWWTPDGDRLAFIHDADWDGYRLSLVDEDGASAVELSARVAPTDDLPFSPDGRRVMFVENAAGGGQDVVIRDLVSGSATRLTGAVASTSSDIVWRLGFARDVGSVLVVTGPRSATDSGPFRLLRGPVTGGALTVLVESLGRDGRSFRTIFQEAATGPLAVMASDSTRIVTAAGAVTRLIGAPSYAPAFDAAGQRLLVDATSSSLRVFPATGAGSGTSMSMYRATPELSTAAYVGHIPFVFGWWGRLALYPSNVTGTFGTTLAHDLRAWDDARNGVVAARIVRYAIAGDRIVFLTSDGALFAARSP